MKKLIIAIWISLMIGVGTVMFLYGQEKAAQPAPIDLKLNVDTPIAKIDIEADNNIEWQLIAKVLTLVLVTYGGIKLINKRIQ
jgi:hypothetical protein